MAVTSYLNPFLIQSAPLLSEVTVVLTSDWKSTESRYRDLIREDIQKKYQATSAILDLTQIPVLKKGCVSISHCRSVGGYAFAPTSELIGFDVEVTSRIRPEHYEKLSVSEQEKSESPGPAYLWTAKEAAFKCLASKKIVKDFKKIKIVNWQKLQDKHYSCLVDLIHPDFEIKAQVFVSQMHDVTAALCAAQLTERKTA